MGSIKNEWGDISDCFNDEHELVNFIFERFDSSGFENSYRDMGGFNEPSEMFKVTLQDKIDSLQEYFNEIIEEKDKLQKENKELKLRLEKSMELPCPVGGEVYVTVNGKRFMSAKLYGKNEDGAYLVLVKISEHKHIYDWFRKIYTKEEAEQELKGGTENE